MGYVSVPAFYIVDALPALGISDIGKFEVGMLFQPVFKEMFSSTPASGLLD